MASMTLATALALFGFAVLAALALQLWWASKRRQRLQQRVERPAAGGGERVEPALGGDGGVGGDSGHPGGEGAAAGRDPQLLDDADTVPLAGDPARPRAGLRRSARLDPLIDAIVPLALDAPISGELAVSHLPPTRRAGTKAFYIEGLDAETGDWDTLRPGHRYSELQAGVQLASRSGALNEIEFSEFMQKVHTFADAVGATVDGAGAPDMLDAVARARELDALSGPLDAQLTVTLQSNGVAWSVGYLQQCAARHGFVPGAVAGRLVLPAQDEGAPPVLVLAFDAQAALAEDPQQAAVRHCTLTLDVPQTAATAEPFPLWHLTATALADDLDATPVDDQGATVTLHAFAAIGRELDALYQKLEALDLAAGSPAARRLFS